jgi:hypothetical protein
MAEEAGEALFAAAGSLALRMPKLKQRTVRIGRMCFIGFGLVCIELSEHMPTAGRVYYLLNLSNTLHPPQILVKSLK